MSRHSKSWVNSFVEYTKHGTSPTLFCKWAAIATVAGALERRVGVYTRQSMLYPNLYTILISPPGVGKTALTKIISELWGSLPEHHVAPSNASSASIIDDLRNATRSLTVTGQKPEDFNSLKICSNELQVLLPQYDSSMMGKLTDIYDGHPYSESRRGGEGKNTFSLARPQINIIAGTTPAQLNSGMPEGIWNHGFMSRVFLIFSSELRRRSLFAGDEQDETLFTEMKQDLRSIGAMNGRMTFTEEAANTIDAWQLGGCVPEPNHPKLYNYNTRRTAHMLKLMMVACASRTDSLVIEEQDFQTALEWMIEAEAHMPEIFRSMKADTSDAKVIEDVWHLVQQWGIRQKGKPMPRVGLIRFMQGRVPSYQIETIIKTMVDSGMIVVKSYPKVGLAFTIGEAAPNEY